MGTRPQEVNRIIDLSHATKIDTMADALAALDVELTIQAGPAAGADALTTAASEAAQAAIEAMAKAQEALAKVAASAPRPARASGMTV